MLLEHFIVRIFIQFISLPRKVFSPVRVQYELDVTKLRIAQVYATA